MRANRKKNRQTDGKQTNGQMDRQVVQANRKKNRQTDGKTDKWTNG